MKQMIITVLTSFLLASPGANEGIEGIWLTSRQDSKIEISQNPDGTYSGKIIWAASPHEKYKGMLVMKDVQYNESQRCYKCPWVYDPRLNISARAKITLSGDTMIVHATKGILSKNEVFIRENDRLLDGKSADNIY